MKIRRESKEITKPEVKQIEKKKGEKEDKV